MDLSHMYVNQNFLFSIPLDDPSQCRVDDPEGFGHESVELMPSHGEHLDGQGGEQGQAHGNQAVPVVTALQVRNGQDHI